ncbi:zinc-binding dehydrogenase [Hoyosella sp. YIM 151337]|uniref:alcohol dehydrogenase catalytic domain-containing protein n=1 Tax=Hoyosella sp. YIM 151337 TaxID=2992742 RepID=UPI002235DB69|nr:zinc-binding dehydrogenase [Hoyosella sp. YIM 151337]MCW4354522.1 zinc-binding dehydrogenase [Hoyosella sp. YIM 151337]
MSAVVIDGGTFTLEQRPLPTVGPQDVLVRVAAAGLNAADLAQAQGAYPAPPGVPADIPGLECAGRVVRAGSGVSGAVGERVMALVGGGAHAEYVAVPATHLIPIPENVDDLTAAGFVEAFSTAWDGLVNQARIGAGERVLITGAAGGVGTALIQVAVGQGACVVASVRDRSLHDKVRALVPGLTVVTPESEEAHGPYDVIVELAAGSGLGAKVHWVHPYGRILVIGLSDWEPVPIRLIDMMTRRARILGTTIRARSIAEKTLVARSVDRHLVPRLAAGEIGVPIDSVFALSKYAHAYQRLAERGKFGKVVLDIDRSA